MSSSTGLVGVPDALYVAVRSRLPGVDPAEREKIAAFIHLQASELAMDNPCVSYRELVEALLSEFVRHNAKPSGQIDLHTLLSDRLTFLGPRGLKAVDGLLLNALEQMVEVRLTEDMSESDLEEYESLGDARQAGAWLQAHYPDYALDEDYLSLSVVADSEQPEGISGYAQARWLGLHRPDFPTQVIELQHRLIGRVDELIRMVGRDGFVAWLTIQLVVNNLPNLDPDEPLPLPDTSWVRR